MLLLAYHALASVVAFAAYGLDKRAACRDRRRTPERALHGMSLLGGWPGALVAMRVFRHKRQKAAFARVFWVTVAVHVAVVVGLVWMMVG
ncbi:MAG: DUF1294 domain-containing protein [Phycisphaerales bacterium]|nr:DUF1294 domain-containing protein [Phycisphaerales bacterium]